MIFPACKTATCRKVPDLSRACATVFTDADRRSLTDRTAMLHLKPDSAPPLSTRDCVKTSTAARIQLASRPQRFEQWRNWRYRLDRWREARRHLCLRRLLIRVSVSKQPRFAPCWTDDGETDRELLTAPIGTVRWG